MHMGAELAVEDVFDILFLKPDTEVYAGNYLTVSKRNAIDCSLSLLFPTPFRASAYAGMLYTSFGSKNPLHRCIQGKGSPILLHLAVL